MEPDVAAATGALVGAVVVGGIAGHFAETGSPLGFIAILVFGAAIGAVAAGYLAFKIAGIRRR